MAARKPVCGGRFEGQLNYTDGSGDSGYLSTDFAPSGGTFVETYDFEPGIFTFAGTFTETDLLFFSFWSATYNDFPSYEVSGFSLFGVISTYKVNQTDGDDDYSGIGFRTGPAQTP